MIQCPVLLKCGIFPRIQASFISSCPFQVNFKLLLSSPTSFLAWIESRNSISWLLIPKLETQKLLSLFWRFSKELKPRFLKFSFIYPLTLQQWTVLLLLTSRKSMTSTRCSGWRRAPANPALWFPWGRFTCLELWKPWTTPETRSHVGNPKEIKGILESEMDLLKQRGVPELFGQTAKDWEGIPPRTRLQRDQVVKYSNAIWITEENRNLEKLKVFHRHEIVFLLDLLPVERTPSNFCWMGSLNVCKQQESHEEALALIPSLKRLQTTGNEDKLKTAIKIIRD